MTREEYAQRLDALRKEYADAIRENSANIKDDYIVIEMAESEAASYRTNVQALIREYQATKEKNS